MRVLHLRTSPLGAQSASRRVGDQLLLRLPPHAVITSLDLAQSPMPHWSPDWAQSTQAQAEIDRLLNTDVLVIEAPMYNFGIPSTLKTWLDTVAQAGRTFHYMAEGPVGHLNNLQVVVVSSRGGSYGDQHAMDFQEAYLRQILGFLGVASDRLRVVRAEGLAQGEQASARAWRDVEADLEKRGRRFQA